MSSDEPVFTRLDELKEFWTVTLFAMWDACNFLHVRLYSPLWTIMRPVVQPGAFDDDELILRGFDFCCDFCGKWVTDYLIQSHLLDHAMKMGFYKTRKEE